MAKIKTSSIGNGEIAKEQLSHIIEIENLLKKIADKKVENTSNKSTSKEDVNLFAEIIDNERKKQATNAAQLNPSKVASMDNLGKVQKDKNKNNEKLNNGLGKVDKKESEEKYGAIKKDSPEAKLLKQIELNTRKQADVAKQEEKEEKGGLLSKILGFAGKLLFPMIAGLILSALKPGIKELLKNFLGGNGGWSGVVGDFLGDALGDMIPGAVGGLMAAKSFGLTPAQGALIGATISYAYSKLLGIVDDLMDMFKGKPREGAGSGKGYLEKALAGAMIGASLNKWQWGMGTARMAFIGAGIGIATEWLLNRVNEMRGLFTGEPVEIKKIPGVDIPEAIVGGIIGGAMVGSSIGGGKGKLNLKGALWGAVIGGTAGAAMTLVTDFNNRFQAAKRGEYQEPTTICGIPAPIFTGIIAGAAIGGKFGGIVGGVIGAAIGGIAGAIYNWGTNVYMSTKAQQKNGQDYKNKYMKDNKILQGVNAQHANLDNQLDSLSEEKAAIQAKIKSGEISQWEGSLKLTEIENKRNSVKSQKSKLNKFDYESNKRITDAFSGHKNNDGTMKQDPMDMNGDGIVTQAELDKWKEKYNGFFASMGGTGRSIRRVQNLIDANGGAGVTKDQLLEASVKHNKLDTKSLPTSNEITSSKLLKEQNATQKQGNATLEKIEEGINKINTSMDQQIQTDANTGEIDTHGSTSSGRILGKRGS